MSRCILTSWAVIWTRVSYSCRSRQHSGWLVRSVGIIPTSALRCVAFVFFFFQAEDGIRDSSVTGVQTCALPICNTLRRHSQAARILIALGAVALLALPAAALLSPQDLSGQAEGLLGMPPGQPQIGRASCRERV